MTTETTQQPSQNKKGWIKILRTWLLVVGTICFWIVLWATVEKHRAQTRPSVSLTGDKVDLFAHVFVMTFLAVFFLAIGIGGYFLALLTQCLTFDFSRQIWTAIKVKMWFANLFVLLCIGMGTGFLASAFLTPILTDLGVTSALAGFLPLIGGVGVIQLVFVWVLLWSPLEKRVIARRLSAIGITPAQLQTGIYLGLSDPAQRSVSKRFGAIEEDVGMLWIASDRLIYYGDSRQLNITREQLVSVERQVDGRSTTALSGTAHVILNFNLPDGTPQRVRLHNEGVITMGRKRSAMESLNSQIETWRSASAPVAKSA
jgi:hypothetical protein